MKVVLTIVVVVLLFALIGWVSFRVSDDQASINVETQKIEKDASDVVEGTKDLLKNDDEDIVVPAPDTAPVTP